MTGDAMRGARDHCGATAASLADYLAGTLDDARTAALEAHAAACAPCAATLERVTRRPVVFAPALPPTLATTTLAAVAARRRRRRLRRAGGAAALAAAVLAIVATREAGVMPTSPSAVVVVDAREGLDAHDTRDDGLPGASMLRTARRHADVAARDEFRALDAAAAELTAALAARPDDAELRGFLASVESQRDALRRRVREVAT